MNNEERTELYAACDHILKDGNNESLGYDYEFRDLGEDMKLLSKSIRGWWKPLILFDCEAKTATLIINPEDMTLQNVEDSDIEWDSLRGLDDKCVERAKARSAVYPTNIRGFSQGTAEVEWQLNPDGMYFMDSDGYGMTDDEEVTLIGRIDHEGKVVDRFTLKQ